MIPTVMVWSIPFLIIPASLIVSRYLPFRKVRYSIYGLFLLAAFVFNLFLVSFWNEIMDTAVSFAITFILLDVFWNVLAIKNRRVVRVLVAIGMIVFGVANFWWIVSGPAKVWKFANPAVISTFNRDGVLYAVKERDLFYLPKPVRTFTLTRKIGDWPLEEKIHTYRSPNCFYRNQFSCKWSDTDQGARVDLCAAGYTLWTMGEGF